MTRFIFFGLAVVGAAVALGCGGVQTLRKDVSQASTIEQIKANPESFVERIKNPGDGILLAIKKGETVTLRLDLKTPSIATLQPGVNTLRFERDVYLFLSRNGVLLSPDGQRWARVEDMKAIKELFGLSRGTLQIGLGVSKEDGAVLSIGLGAE